MHRFTYHLSLITHHFSNVRFVPYFGGGALDGSLELASAQQEVALLQRPAPVGTDEGHSLGGQAEGDGLLLSRLKLHLGEVAQTLVVGRERGHEVAGVEQHGLLAGTLAGVLDIDADGDDVVGAKLLAVGTQVGVFKGGVAQSVAEGP